MATAKLTAIWRIITSSSATLITQRKPGDMPGTLSYGRGEISDLVLAATAIKRLYDNLTDTINEAAAEAGELHTLQELRDAVETLEHTDGRN